jgi:hypothetical protein
VAYGLNKNIWSIARIEGVKSITDITINKETKTLTFIDATNTQASINYTSSFEMFTGVGGTIVVPMTGILSNLPTPTPTPDTTISETVEISLDDILDKNSHYTDQVPTRKKQIDFFQIWHKYRGYLIHYNSISALGFLYRDDQIPVIT